MDSLEANMPERLGRPREPLPNLRGEDETEIRYLIDLIETQSWILSPLKCPSCILGRHPPPKASANSSSKQKAVDPSTAFCTSLYSIEQGGVRSLELGPEMGSSRKEALGNLLGVVEMEIGRMMLNHHAKKAARDGGGSVGSGSMGRGERG
ncbi:hypothetical protein BKA58DRAFT_464968 [Alternaria rosae]|uniref:uncharacterized protein n=1 Tax=Alternaria rosae TaxID=1187941 RepID=UPI001E8D2D1D|nr:uncharacterized protein BKA58DRAFT_464968 [Alternaria rosae]KAH6883092.1 hypothetical protein BKA58DRAFT_464968 [Alternaria rosae]